MLTTLVLTLLAADPTPQQVELLKTFRDEFVAIAPGEGEFPKSNTISRFEIAKYEVPQNLWEAVMGANPSKWKGKRNSVEMISLHEANDFCLKATDLMQAAKLIDANQFVRVPTEEQWEYAARAGTTTKYSFGDDEAKLGDYAWFTGNAAGNDPPVGAKKPNPWGLYDMHGYLWEWTGDFGKTVTDGPKKGVLRSGSWKDKAEELATASRREADATLRDDAVGLRCVLVRLGASGAVAVESSDFAPMAQAEIVPAGSKLEILWAEGEFTEGPALAPDGSIIFSDIGTTMYRFDPKTGKTAVFRSPSGRSNGLMFNQKGELLAAEGANSGGKRRISITTGIDSAKDGTVKTLSDKFDGKRFNSPNDLAIDAKGNVYFTDPRYVGDDPRDLDYEAVFLVAPDGTTRIATRDVQKPNGILVSPDGKTVYVADNNPQGNRHLAAFAVKADATLGEKEVLHDFGGGRGIDGMTLDTEGNIYATAGTGDKAGIYVFSPAGKHLAFIPTPGDPTNCVFGGGTSGESTLYITSANSKQADTKYGLFRIKLAAKGFHVVKLAAAPADKAWRTLPLVADGKVSPEWQHVGFGKLAVDGDSVKTECDERGLGLAVWTKEKLGDCQIRVVFRTEHERSNAGVIVRLDGGVLDWVGKDSPAVKRDQDGNLLPGMAEKMQEASDKELGAWYAVHHGYEVQICDTGDAIHRTGAVYSLAPAAEAPKTKTGEWRTMIIALDGNVVKVELDGQPVTTFDPASKDLPARKQWYEPKRESKRPTSGYIGLQTHDPGDVVWFKEVSVRK